MHMLSSCIKLFFLMVLVNVNIIESSCYWSDRGKSFVRKQWFFFFFFSQALILNVFRHFKMARSHRIWNKYNLDNSLMLKDACASLISFPVVSFCHTWQTIDRWSSDSDQNSDDNWCQHIKGQRTNDRWISNGEMEDVSRPLLRHWTITWDENDKTSSR